MTCLMFHQTFFYVAISQVVWVIITITITNSKYKIKCHKLPHKRCNKRRSIELWMQLLQQSPIHSMKAAHWDMKQKYEPGSPVLLGLYTAYWRMLPLCWLIQWFRIGLLTEHLYIWTCIYNTSDSHHTYLQYTLPLGSDLSADFNHYYVIVAVKKYLEKHEWNLRDVSVSYEATYCATVL